jgi:dihydropteroate synthase
VADRWLFVTGKLAAPALRRTLERADLPFEYEIAVMKITVAALMTAPWIARFLEVPAGVTRIMLPGLCEGDPAVLAERFGVPAEKGPADLKELPGFFGRADVRAAYGPRDVRVFAEINNVPYLSREEILDRATYFHESGADVIDLGLSLDRDWLRDGPSVIAELRKRGLSLSIDTLNPDEILMADRAGVDYVLSLNGQNRHVAEGLRAVPVLIPDTPDDLDSLEATIAHLERLGKPYLVDPILAPIGSGFAESLGRYLEVRRRHSEAGMLMGIGNLTELTEADTTGVTAILIGFCEEVGIRHVLTTEVIDWARGAVTEAVLAAKLMHFARDQGTPPKHVNGQLLTVKDDDFRPYAEAELRELHDAVRDPNIRIFADADSLYAFNADRFVKGTDINEMFDRLGVDEATHAFYLGKELMKAAIARGLRKNYRQESPLDWGYMTFPEPRRERVRLTSGRPARARPAADRRDGERSPTAEQGAAQPERGREAK